MKTPVWLRVWRTVAVVMVSSALASSIVRGDVTGIVIGQAVLIFVVVATYERGKE